MATTDRTDGVNQWLANNGAAGFGDTLAAGFFQVFGLFVGGRVVVDTTMGPSAMPSSAPPIRRTTVYGNGCPCGRLLTVFERAPNSALPGGLQLDPAAEVDAVEFGAGAHEPASSAFQ